MIRDKYRSFYQLEPLTLVLAVVLITGLAFPTLSHGRSKTHKGADPYPRTRSIYREMSSNHLQVVDYRGGQPNCPTTDRKRRFFLQAKNYKKGYRKLSPEEKKRLKKKYQQWRSMPQERQQLLRQRMEKWNQLPSEERELMHQRFQQWKKLPPEEREQTREKLRKWNGLSPEEKEKIRKKFRGPTSRHRP